MPKGNIKGEDSAITSQNNRDFIFQKAVKLFAEHGYERVSVRRICQEAGIAIGTFYKHYKSKQEIFRDLYAATDAAVKSLPEDSDLSFEEEVLRFIDIQLSVAQKVQEEMGQFRRTFISLLALEGQGHHLEKKEIFFRLVNAVMKAQHIGEVSRDLEAHELARKIMRFVRGIILDWCLYDCAYDLKRETRAEVRAYLGLYSFDPERKNALNLTKPMLK